MLSLGKRSSITSKSMGNVPNAHDLSYGSVYMIHILSLVSKLCSLINLQLACTIVANCCD